MSNRYSRRIVIHFALLSLLSASGIHVPAVADTPQPGQNANAAQAEPGFTPLFDGKSLEGWDGNPDFWSVRDGVITGQTTEEKPTKGNTFLIWRGGMVDDFELRLQFRIVGGNSGIQYRSQEVEKWVIRGYQADMDAAGMWTGAMYEERGRGVLGSPGQKVAITADGKKEELGSTCDPKAMWADVKKEDWNDYTIRAQGSHLQHSVNGHMTADLQDREVKSAAANGLLALQLHSGPPMLVQFRNLRLKRLPADESGTSQSDSAKKVVFLAGKPSHRYGQHAHFAGCSLLARELQRQYPNWQVIVHRDNGELHESLTKDLDCLVFYADGGKSHPALPHLATIDALAERGTGIVCIHYAVEIPKGESGDHLLKWIGGYFETDWSVNPHWTADFTRLPEHPITRGVEPFAIEDEWYYHMRFPETMTGVVPILTAVPPASTLDRPDGPHSGNPHVRRAAGQPQHVAWAIERPDGGRGFGFTGGHFHWNWGNPNFMQLMLNAIAWTSRADVPTTGVRHESITLADLEKRQDFAPPADFDRQAVQKRLRLPAEQ